MKNIFGLLILLTSLFFPQNYPVAGKKFQVEYDPSEKNILADSKEVKVVYAFDYWSIVGQPEGGHSSLFGNVLNPDSGRAHETVMQKKQNKWYAEIEIPGDAALLSYYFTDGNKSDYNDEKTYIAYICDENGKPVKNARFRNIDFLLMAGKDTTEAIKEIDKEIADYPDNAIAHLVYWRYNLSIAKDYESLFDLRNNLEKEFGELKEKYKNNIDILVIEVKTLDNWMSAVFGIYQKQREKMNSDFIKAYEANPKEMKSETANKMYAQYKKSKESNEFIENVIGTKAQDFEFTSLDGKKMKLSDLKNKFVLLDFWGTWCGPCVAEIPNLVKAYAKFKDKGFEIISISSDGLMNNKSEKEISEFAKSKKMSWIHLLDDKTTKVHDLYKISHWPTLYLVDKDGIVVKNEKVLRGNDLTKTLTELLGE